MGVLNFVNALLRKTLRLIIFTVRIHAVIISYIVTSIAWIFHGKEALDKHYKIEEVEELIEPCNDYKYLETIYESSEAENERYVYVDTAIIAVDQFWSKAEEKIWEMAKRQVPIETKMLLLDAIQESYNKLKDKLRDDLQGQGVDLDERFETLVAEGDTKLAELRFLLIHYEDRQDYTLDIQDEKRPSSAPSIENQIESLNQVLSSADMLAKRPQSSMTEVIPALKDVQREVSQMLQYLEGWRGRHCFDPKLLKDLTAEYQYESARY